jgi:hypothetical protein
MSFNLFRGQLAQVIEWADSQPGLLLWKFPSANDELQAQREEAVLLVAKPG